jgi:putative flippase GtrA
MRSAGLAGRYVAFAIVATLINLAAQWVSFRLYQGIGEFAVGVAVGTAAGLVAKYLLDKFWIFDDVSLQVTENLKKFAKYSLTGAFTTAIFWGTEAAFTFLGKHEAMRYLGAVVGLAIGYAVKFHLDYRFVFRVKS